jgi:hypothetical protein
MMNGSSSYQVSIAFFLGSAFGLLLSEMKHGLISAANFKCGHVISVTINDN